MKYKAFVIVALAVVLMNVFAHAAEDQGATINSRETSAVISAGTTETYGGRWCITGEQEDPQEPVEPPPDCVPGE